MLLYATNNLKGLDEAIKELGITRLRFQNACKRGKVPYAYGLYWLAQVWKNNWTHHCSNITGKNYDKHMIQSWNMDCGCALMFITPVVEEDTGYKLA